MFAFAKTIKTCKMLLRNFALLNRNCKRQLKTGQNSSIECRWENAMRKRLRESERDGERDRKREGAGDKLPRSCCRCQLKFTQTTSQILCLTFSLSVVNLAKRQTSPSLSLCLLLAYSWYVFFSCSSEFSCDLDLGFAFHLSIVWKSCEYMWQSASQLVS